MMLVTITSLDICWVILEFKSVWNLKLSCYLSFKYTHTHTHAVLRVGFTVGWSDGWIVGVVDGFLLGFNDGVAEGFIEGITGQKS